MKKLIKKIKRRIRQLKAMLDKIGAKGWDRVFLTFDIYYCRKILHATNQEYLTYKFYNLKNRYRKQFMLIYHQQNFMRYLGKPRFTVYKYQFHQHIPQFFQRELILAPECGAEAFVNFVKSHGKVVVKPNMGSYGRDIEMLHYTNDEDILNYFNNIKRDTVCEEFVIQHDTMNQFNASSVNTIRIVSLRIDNEIVITGAALRSAAIPGNFTDNIHTGGLCAQVDISTGVLYTHGSNYDGKQCIKHPVTGCTILGFQIPHWDKAIELVKSAHAAIKECDYLGWDIAITPTGVDIIEAGNAPDPLLIQSADAIPKGTLVLPPPQSPQKNRQGR